MTAFGHFSNSCYPQQPKFYKEAQRKKGSQNYGVDNTNYIWNSAASKSKANPYLYEGIEPGDSKKRRIRTLKSWPNDPTLKQPDGLRKGQSSRHIEIFRLHGGSYSKVSLAPLFQQPFLDKEKRPKRRKQHEKRLQEEKSMDIMGLNQVKKREALGKLRRNLEIDLQQAVWKPGNNPYGDHLGQVKPDLNEEDKSKQSPEEVERALLKLFLRLRRLRKDNKKVSEVPSSGVLNTPLGKKVKIQKATQKRSQRKIKAKAEYTTPGLPRSLQKSPQHILVRPPTPTARFDQMLQGEAAKVPELHPLLKSIHVLQTISPEIELKRKATKVGAKFSWNFRHKLKAKAMPKPKMSRELYKVLTGKEVKIPELRPAFKSHHQIIFEKRKTKKDEWKQVKSAGKAPSGAQKTKQIGEPEPNYGLRTTEGTTYSHRDGERPQITQQFHKMLKGKQAAIPELNVQLMSHFEIFPKRKPQPQLFESTTPLSKLKPSVSRAHDQMWQKGNYKSSEDKENSSSEKQIDSDELPLDSRLMSPSGRKVRLKKFNHYIRHSAPDWRIVKQIGSKRSIAYLAKKSNTSLWSAKSGSTRNSRRTRPSSVVMPGTGHSLISTTYITRSKLSLRAKEAMETKRKNEDDLMFDTVPEDSQPQHNQDPNIKSELIADTAKADKAKKKSQSKRDKHTPEGPEGEARRKSILSLKSVSEEIKEFDRQALKEEREREQYEENYLVEERAAAQARIQELMKYVAIREDFHPPKPPRNFVKENILRLQKMRPQKKSVEVKEKRKSNNKYHIMGKSLQMPKLPEPDIIQKTTAPILRRTERCWNREEVENQLCSNTAKVCDNQSLKRNLICGRSSDKRCIL